MPGLTLDRTTGLPYRTESPRPDDPEIIDEVVDGMTRGLSSRAIAANARIGRTTLDEWLRNGQLELADYHAGDTQELGSYGVFYSEVERAYAAFEMRKVDRVEAAGPDWVASLAHVTRRNPQDWAERRYEHATAEIQVLSVSVALPALPEQQLLQLLADKLQDGVKLLPPPPD